MLRQVFAGGYGVPSDQGGVLGILSVIFWSLIWVVSIKYVVFILRATNQGEGGIMALTALALRTTSRYPTLSKVLTLLGLFGAALFYGDGMITPAISVLSAVEGLHLAFSGLERWVVPLSVVILITLFLLQKKGTARIGIMFGPVMVLWFVVLGVLGIYGIAQRPEVLQALNPAWAVRFFVDHSAIGLTILGAVVLALTGAEALYADVGHFGRQPISRAWFFLVFPALTLNYFGQGAVILEGTGIVHSPFYLLAPGWALLPMILLSTLATIIASQAVISGAFSLTHQAMQLGYIPRMLIQHPSGEESGQIYIGTVNWALMTGVVLLVVGFRTSGALAAAYGVAVTGTMLITSVLFSAVVLLSWKASRWLAIPMLLGLLVVDSLYFAAATPKIFHGGAFPVIAGLVLFTLMTTWKQGRKIIVEQLDESALPLPLFIESISSQPVHRVEGTAVFLTAQSGITPHSLLHNIRCNRVLHDQVVILTVIFEDSPRLPPEGRFEIEAYPQGIFRVNLHFGFKEDPDIPLALSQCPVKELDFDPMRTTFFLSRETVVPGRRAGLARWREGLFAFLLKNANGNLRYFKLPPSRVVELGAQVEM